MKIDFCEIAKRIGTRDPSSRQCHCIYRIPLNERYSVTILVGRSSGDFSATNYSWPNTIDRNDYERVLIYINIAGKNYDVLTLDISVSNPASPFYNFPKDLFEEILYTEVVGSFNTVSISVIQNLFERFGVMSAANYCNNCGIQLTEQKDLCWACEHDI